jgi:quinol monooxygenase YgiN
VIIIITELTLQPEDRHRFLDSAGSLTQAARARPGCLDHAYLADPIDPHRVLGIERWEAPQMHADFVSATAAEFDRIRRHITPIAERPSRYIVSTISTPRAFNS